MRSCLEAGHETSGRGSCPCTATPSCRVRAGLEEAALGAVATHGAGPVSLSPRGTMVGAESTFAFTRGARCVALAGGQATFHMETDRWPDAVPDAVNVEAAVSYANAFADLTVRLANEPEDNLLA